MAHKICPRCGEQYATLKSDTCPQCFAKLTLVDESTAAEMAAARAAIEQSPEFQSAKAEEDERFRHESFQACLALVAMAVGVALVVVVAILIAARTRRGHGDAPAPSHAAVTAQTRVADVMPPGCGTFVRSEMDQRTALSGTVAIIYHAAYTPSTGSATDHAPPSKEAASAGSTVDVYAWQLDRPASEQARFLTGLQMAAEMGGQPHAVAEVDGRLFRYEIVGPAAVNGTPNRTTAEFVRVWTVQVGGRK